MGVVAGTGETVASGMATGAGCWPRAAFQAQNAKSREASRGGKAKRRLIRAVAMINCKQFGEERKLFDPLALESGKRW